MKSPPPQIKVSRATTDWPPLLILSEETGLLSTRLLFRKRGTGICNQFITSSILLINYSFFYPHQFSLLISITICTRYLFVLTSFWQFISGARVKTRMHSLKTPRIRAMGVNDSACNTLNGWTVRNDWLKYGWRSLCQIWNEQLLHVL